MPTPCSPVIEPPTPPTVRGFRRRTPSARSQFAGLAASYMISGCRLPSPAWKTLAQRRPYFFSSSAMARQHLGQPLARDGAVHAVVVGRDAADRRKGRLAPGPEAQRSASDCETRNVAGAGSRSTPRRRGRSPRRPPPACRRPRTAGSPRRQVVAGLHEGSTAAVAGLSIISSPAGMMPAAMIAATASPAWRRRRKGHDHLRQFRLGHQLHRDLGDDAEHTLRSRSAAPAGRSRAHPSAAEPISKTSPSMLTTRMRSTLCTVSPYFRQCTPPEFSATLPPSVQAICDDGSGA
jgi:hypothetical protein